MMKLICSALLAIAFLVMPCSQAQARPTQAPLLAPQSVPPIQSLGNPEQPRVPSILQNPDLRLSRYLEYFVDEQRNLDIEAVAKDEFSKKFAPFEPSKLKGKDGVLWLRFVLSPSHLEAGSPPPLFLDLGDSVIGKPAYYNLVPPLENAAPEWKETILDKRISQLPDPAAEEEKLFYLRFDTLPSRWFDPTMRTAESAIDNSGIYYRLAGVVAFGVLLLVCLFSTFTEAGAWRSWAFLYLVVAGFQAWAGSAQGQAEANFLSSLGTFLYTLPGLAILLYPHLARYLLRCPQEARFLNAQFLLLSLVGLLLIVVPFIPAFKWMEHYADCWPLVLAIFVPSSLVGLIYRRPGAGRLFLGSILPPLAVAFAWCYAESDRFSSEFMAALPVWGTALGALFVTGLPCRVQNPTQGGGGGLELNAPDTPLQAISAQQNQRPQQAPLSEESAPLSLQQEEPQPPRKLDMDLSMPIQNGLPPLLNDSNDTLSNGLHLTSEPTPASRRLLLAEDAPKSNVTKLDKQLSGTTAENPNQKAGKTSERIFDLKGLLKVARDNARKHALVSQCQLLWSTPQQLEQLYKGPAELFLKTLDVCTKEICAKEGSSPEFSFSHADGGEGKFLVSLSSETRFSPEAFLLAKQLSDASGGSISIENKEESSKLSFTVQFSTVREDKEAEKNTRSPLLNLLPGQESKTKLEVLILADTPQVSVRILSILKNYPAHVRLAANPQDLVSLHRNLPAHMIIIQGRAATPHAAALIKAIQASSNQDVSILAYTIDEKSWNELAHVGFTHALTLPVDQASFLETFDEVMRGHSLTIAQANIPPTHPTVAGEALLPSSGQQANLLSMPGKQKSFSVNTTPLSRPSNLQDVPLSLEAEDGRLSLASPQTLPKNPNKKILPTDLPHEETAPASPKDSMRFHLDQAKGFLGKGKQVELSIAAGTIAAIAARLEMREISRQATTLARTARNGDMEKSREALSELARLLATQI